MEWIKKLFKQNNSFSNYVQLPEPDGSIEYFKAIKHLSESYFEENDINPKIYGFQIQQGSKWRPGLTNDQIERFEIDIGIKFSDELIHYYMTMNGLDKPGVNVFGSKGDEHTFYPVFYSYPDDLSEIKKMIAWAEKSNGLSREKMLDENIPMILPIANHNFIVFDGNNPILSIYGDDIICSSESLSKFIVREIFHSIYNAYDFESPPNCFPSIRFWNEQ